MQRSGAVVPVRAIDVGSLVDQHPGDLDVPQQGRPVERSDPEFRTRGVEIGTLVEHLLDCRDILSADCPDEPPTNTLDGTGTGVRIETLGFVSRAYDAELRAALAACAEVTTSNVRLVSQLHARLGDVFAEVAEAALAEAGLTADALDLVGSHGQTVQHVPEAEEVAGVPVRSTLQIGCPAVLATRLGTPVVADFRAGDVALGGQGAPLAPTLDGALFAHPDEARVLLNLGGIANLTVLPPGGPPRAAFDTGPANMVLDALALRLTGTPYDADGALAAQGTPDDALVADVLAAPFFAAAPPKSTGREDFGAPFVDWLVGRGPSAPADLMATATASSTDHRE